MVPPVLPSVCVGGAGLPDFDRGHDERHQLRFREFRHIKCPGIQVVVDDEGEERRASEQQQLAPQYMLAEREQLERIEHVCHAVCRAGRVSDRPAMRHGLRWRHERSAHRAAQVDVTKRRGPVVQVRLRGLVRLDVGSQHVLRVHGDELEPGIPMPVGGGTGDEAGAIRTAILSCHRRFEIQNDFMRGSTHWLRSFRCSPDASAASAAPLPACPVLTVRRQARLERRKLPEGR